MKLTLTGVAAAIMMNISAIAGLNDPQLKITPVGFLKMLLENNAMTEVNNLSDIQAGQKRSIEIKYMQRGIESEVSSVDDCDTPITAAWKTTSIGNPLFSKVGIFISDEDMRKYVTAATNPQALGNSAQAVSKALYETVLTYINALLQKIDGNLVAAQALKFGVNAAYASADAQSIALGTKAKMDDGVVKLVLDAEANEVYDELLICGNGLVRAFDVYNKLKSGTDANGFGALDLKAYSDPKTVAGWGANHFGVFAKGTVGFVDCPQNVGIYAGEQGGSFFFQLPMPLPLSDGTILPLAFDCQLKYIDCPEKNGEGEVIAKRGWKLIISKTYGLFNLPSDCFKSGDPLYGVNGSFHYVATAQDESVEVRNAAGTTLAVSQTAEAENPSNDAPAAGGENEPANGGEGGER